MGPKKLFKEKPPAPAPAAPAKPKRGHGTTGSRPRAIHPDNKSGAKEEATQKRATMDKFLEAYEQGGAMHWAAAQANISVATIERWRAEDADFDLAVLSAYDRSTDKLKLTAYLRAMKGDSKGSDSLMMFLIKQRDPSFRESFGIQGTHLHAGAISNPTKVPASVQAAVDAVALDLVIKMAEKL